MLIILLLSLVIIHFSTVFSDLDDVYSSKSSDDYVPCQKGWYYFRDRCYRVATRSQRFSWTAALNKCKGYGADLVSIQSQEEQDFIVAFLLLDIKWVSWTGLNDRDKEGDFQWSDGSVFNYSNWQTNQPDGSDSYGLEADCVHIICEPNTENVGNWNDRSCDATEYALCEMKANHRKRSPNLKYCSPTEGGGWKYEKSCFHIVTEMTSWQNAEKYCKRNYNGHLLTVRDMLQDYFLELALPDIRNEEIWIGIKIKDQLQQKWTSGWYVTYDGFSKEEGYVEGTCVARKNRKEWITTPCSRELPFICEVFTEKPRIPILKPPPIGAHCPKDLDDWRDLGGEYCYHIETTKSINFYEANFDCQRRGGQMLSLHSQEEADILQPFVIHKRNEIFIGLIRHKGNNEEKFGWTDGSTLDYENWAPGEPNLEDEKCVQAVTSTMVWGDIPCVWDSRGYICSVKKIIPNSSPADGLGNCKSFCIAPYSYLYGLLIQCPDAKEIL